MSLKEMKIFAVGTEDYEVMDEKARPVKSIAEMKAIENLKAGDIIKTIGYYSANDGGGATYLIKEKLESDIEDNGAIHFINDRLVATLIHNDRINVKQFGAKGDGETDDTTAIQNASNYCKNNDLIFYLPASLTSFKVTTLSLIDITKIIIKGVIEPSNYVEIKENINSVIHTELDIFYIKGELRLYGLNSAIVKIKTDISSTALTT